MSSYITVDKAAAEAIISNRYLQTCEFEQGAALADFIKGAALARALDPHIRVTSTKNGAHVISRSGPQACVLIIDLKSAPLFAGVAQEDALVIFQKLLRFCVRYWSGQRLSKNEIVIPQSSKAVLFPFPISSQSSFRISIEREPDARRMAKRERQGQYLLVYKCGTTEGEGSSEKAELTVFRKAISELADTTSEIEVSLGEMRGEIGSLRVTELGHQTSTPMPPHMGFEQWDRLLTQKQKEFVRAPLRAPHRIEGPAGTGKTLCLVLKCIHELITAEKENQDCAAAFVTHSDETRRAIVEMFAANDASGFYARNPDASPRYVQIWTLHQLCAERVLRTHISETEFLDRDAMESKNLQLLYVDEVLDDAMKADYPTHRHFLSSNFQTYLDSESRWNVAEMMQHEISVVIKGRAGEDLDVYRKLPRLQYGLPIVSEADRNFVFVVFKKYQQRLEAIAQFDTDDIALTAIGQLDTPIWRRRRVREGFDAIFVDETHLFNMNELSVFHHLTKKDGPYAIAYSVDRSQAIGDRGWGNGTIASAIEGNGATEQGQTAVRAVFRCAPEIVELAFSVTSSGASLFTNFDNPLLLASSTFTEEEERMAAPPRYISYANDDAMIQASFERAQCLADELNVTRGEVLVVAFDNETLEGLKKYAVEVNKPAVTLERRGDMGLANQARKSGQFVLGHADYVGGLEFSGVVLVGVDEGRVPPARNGTGADSANFLSYSSHNRLYVAITRARYRVEILGVDSRAPSVLLHSALNSGLLVKADRSGG